MLKQKKEMAVYTIVRNEKFFLPIWLAYYRKHFSDNDIYILDHESSDGSTNGIKNVITIRNKLTQDNKWLIDVTCDFQKHLLKSYENVLFVNVDEFVVAKNTLREFIRNNDHIFVKCVGFEVIQMLNEKPYDESTEIFKQRKFWYRNTVYDKPLLCKSPIEWTGGWHNCKNVNAEQNNDLYLAHMHRVDYTSCMARHNKTASEQIFLPDLENKKWGWHHTVSENSDFSKWFYSIDIAKILDAEKSLKMFQKNRNLTFNEIYKKAEELVEVIQQNHWIIGQL